MKQSISILKRYAEVEDKETDFIYLMHSHTIQKYQKIQICINL